MNSHPDNSLSNIDKVLLAGSLCFALAFGALLVREDLLLSLLQKRTEASSIGQILVAQNDVRRRHIQSLAWYNIRARELVYENDSIFTGSDSTISLNLNNDQTLDLEPNSLVVLRTRGNDTVLELQLGSIMTRSTPEAPIQILDGSRVTRVRSTRQGGRVRVNRQAQGATTIEAQESEVEVTVGETVALIQPAQPVSVIENQIVPLTEPVPAEVPIEAPAQSPLAEESLDDTVIEEPFEEKLSEPEKLFSETDRPRLQNKSQKSLLDFNENVDIRSPASISQNMKNPPVLTWTPLENAESYVLEIAQDKNFRNPLRYEPLTNPQMAWRDAKPGSYYWRVQARAQNESSQFSEVAALEVGLNAPQLTDLKPLEETVSNLSAYRSSRSIEVQWDPLPLAQAYRFIASEEGSELPPVIVESTSKAFELKPNRSYEFKVAAIDESGQRISPYASTNTKITRELSLRPPELNLPMDKTTVVAFSNDKINPLMFTWEGVKESSGYELQFSLDPEFTDVIATKTPSSNSFVLTERIADGEIYWRVRYKIEDHASKWSNVRRYTLDGPKN